MAGLTGWHLLILLGVVVLLFGAKRLPETARALGQSARIFKRETKDTAVAAPPDQEMPAPKPTSDATDPPTQ
ncbi:MAG: twin-arginine translocase TatA/TatE family subunit [Pseudonocardiaceae bacterium]